jgi:hypothetical protein
MGNTQIVFGMVVFYGILAVLLTLYGNSAYGVAEDPAWVNEWNSRLESDETGFWERTFINIVLFFWGIISFALNFFYVVSGMPWWLNTILFVPLGIMATFIVASFIRGNDG